MDGASHTNMFPSPCWPVAITADADFRESYRWIDDKDVMRNKIQEWDVSVGLDRWTWKANVKKCDWLYVYEGTNKTVNRQRMKEELNKK